MPEFEPTEELRRLVNILAACGTPQATIALEVVNPRTNASIDETTLRKHFRQELDHGKARANARMAQSLYQGGIGRPNVYDKRDNLIESEIKPNPSEKMFWLKCQAGWKESIDVNVVDEVEKQRALNDEVDRIGTRDIKQLLRIFGKLASES